MKCYHLYSWNVNGIRAIAKKGFFEWVNQIPPAIIGLQETKARPDQLSDQIKIIKGYQSYWNAAQRKGYSGVCLYSCEEPLSVAYGLGEERFDCEGRVIIAEYKHLFLLNIYFPNGKRDQQRLQYKLDFYRKLLAFLGELKRKKKTVVICGDFNTAHKEIDLARPKENRYTSGFLPQERELLDELVDMGFVDSLRVFNQQPENYTWWDMQTRARQRNVGWRIDYFFIDKLSVKNLKNAQIHSDVFGSDHCPVSIELQY